MHYYLIKLPSSKKTDYLDVTAIIPLAIMRGQPITLYKPHNINGTIRAMIQVIPIHKSFDYNKIHSNTNILFHQSKSITSKKGTDNKIKSFKNVDTVNYNHYVNISLTSSKPDEKKGNND